MRSGGGIWEGWEDWKSGERIGVGVKMYYILPGYLQMEAEHALRIAGHYEPEDNGSTDTHTTIPQRPS